MLHQPRVPVQAPHALHAPEGRATTPPDDNGRTTSTGQPRAGEDEPESTRDNDERIKATSHKGRHQHQPGCDEHAAETGTPETPAPDHP